VSDLSPLRDMKLDRLYCQNTPIASLTPLVNMPLTFLWCGATQVSDLSPLKGMKLTSLQFFRTKVSDLSPLKGMPLKALQCDFKAERDGEILRSITTLKTINDKDAKQFWKEVDAKKAGK
jgi:hypothetical protein